jgi:hypothetical protein
MTRISSVNGDRFGTRVGFGGGKALAAGKLGFWQTCGKSTWFWHMQSGVCNSFDCVVVCSRPNRRFCHTLINPACRSHTDRQRGGNLTPTPAGCTQLDYRGTIEHSPRPQGSLSVDCPFIDSRLLSARADGDIQQGQAAFQNGVRVSSGKSERRQRGRTMTFTCRVRAARIIRGCATSAGTTWG